MTDKDRINEKDLILRAKSGDDKAFEEIIQMYQKKVCTTISYMIKDKDSVEDVAQEVFIKVYSNLKKFNEQSSLFTWIYRITMNACYDEIKREKKISFFRNYVEEDGEEEEIEREDPNQNVHEIVEERLNRAKLIATLKRLPKEQRALIVLRDIRGFSYWKIADMLKLKLGTVKSQINRARRKLKDELEASGLGDFNIDDSNQI